MTRRTDGAGCGGRTGFQNFFRFHAMCAAALLALVGGCVPLDDDVRRRRIAAPAGDLRSAATPTSLRPADIYGAPQATAPAGDYGLAETERYVGAGFAAPPRSQVEVGEEGTVTLNFVGADVRDVVDALLGDTLGVNYVVDPAVSGPVTARTAEPLSRDDVIPALENVLALRGAGLTRSGDLYRVAPLRDGAFGVAAPVVAPSAQDFAQGYGAYVKPLDHADAADLEELLQPFVPAGRVLRADAERGLLIFAGSGAEARDLFDMVDALDVDVMAGKSFALVPVRVADAAAIVPELEGVFEAAGEEPGAVRFLPVERLRAVLVVASRPSALNQAEAWVRRLDRGVESGERRIFVHYAENAQAADLADVLSRLFEESGAPAATPLAPGLEPVEIGFAPEVDLGVETTEADAVAEPAPRRRAEPARARSTTTPEGVSIVADERNNALVIRATPSEYRMIEDTIRRLDVVPLQVLIEATIAEVTLNDRLQYGLQWFFEAGKSEFTLSSFAGGAVSPVFPGFDYVFSSGDARVVLSALSQITDVNVVSSPTVMVLDNRPARLQVGDEVPVPIQLARSVENPAAPVVNTIQFRDTGVILEVTPRVSSSGLVVLDVVQEVSDVVPTTSSNLDAPTIQQRRIESQVVVQSGESVALGGLIRDGVRTGRSGVPVLSSVPVLGALFSTTTDFEERTELLVIITPRVVSNRVEAQAATEELRRRLRRLDPLVERIR